MASFVTVKTTDDSNYIALGQFIGDNIVDWNGTERFFTVNGPSGATATFVGQDFEYTQDEDHLPVAGTVKSITLKLGTVEIAVVSGLTIDVGFATQAFLQGGFAAVVGLFGDMRVTGNIGNDVLAAGLGDDVFFGGKGADTMFGLDGNDTVSYFKSGAGVNASLASPLNPAGNTGDAAGDQYGSIQNLTGTKFNDNLSGDGAANTLDGKSGNDSLKGAGGRDILIGGLGNDSLTGGRGPDTLKGAGGADKFIFNALNEGGDKVAFFDSLDKVHVKASAFGIESGEFNFFASAAPAAPDASAAFLYDTDDKQLIWDANGSADGGRTTLFTITGFGGVQANDIILI